MYCLTPKVPTVPDEEWFCGRYRTTSTLFVLLSDVLSNDGSAVRLVPQTVASKISTKAKKQKKRYSRKK